MRIGINLMHLSRHEAGVAGYARSLVKALLGWGRAHTFLLYGRSRFLKELRSNNVTLRPVRFLPDNRWFRIIGEQFVVGGDIRLRRPDVFHWPDYSRSLFAPLAGSVVTVHDLAFLRLDNIYDPWRRLYKKIMARVSIRRAEAVIAVSENTASDLTELLHIPRERISVVPNGVDAIFQQLPSSMCEDYRARRLGGIGPFILFVGTMEPRKNVERLLEAYNMLPGMGVSGVHLVLAGQRGWQSEQIVNAIRKGIAAGSVHWLGYVPKEELPMLYNLCRIFVYPSLYEGFGFPPLEAMACGAPVITSANSSLSEVSGDAALLVNPLDVEAMAGAMATLLHDGARSDNARLRGLERSRAYKWEETARLTMDVYQKVCCR